MSGTDLPLVAVIATGGTIASRRQADGAASPEVDGQALLAKLTGLPPVRLRALDLFAKDSSSLTLADMQALSDAVAVQLADPQVAGVVVLHGTDAMEESTLLVALQQRPGKPVIFTGAQFSDDHPEADGPANMVAAIAAALSAASGVHVAFGGRLLPAWGLYKHSTDSADAFRQALDATDPGLRLGAPVTGIRVDLVAIHPGAEPAHLDASLSGGAQGIVLVALGSGNASSTITAAVARATAAGVPVVLSSRVPTGRLATTYGGGGGGHDLVQAGAILSPVLRAGQSRVLLAAAIASGAVDDLPTVLNPA